MSQKSSLLQPAKSDDVDGLSSTKCAARSSRNEAENHGHVAKFVAGEGDGFIETADGREVYFHRNSVLDDAFEHLTVGSEVRFAEEMGRKARRPARFVWWVSTIWFRR